MKICKCLNCGKEFIKIKRPKKKNIKYCCSKCYWEYHLKHYIRKDGKIEN